MAGELNLVSSVTVSSDVSYVDLTGTDATYDIYRVVIHNARVNNTSGGGWRMRWLVSSSPEPGNNHYTQWASHTGAGDFQWYGLATDYRYSGNDLMYIGDGSSDTGESFNGVIDLYKTHDSDSEGRFLVETLGTSTGGDLYAFKGGGYRKAKQAYNGVRIFVASYDIASGTFSLYGYNYS